MAEHSPLPWNKSRDGRRADCNCGIDSETVGRLDGWKEADIDLMIASVNACRGLNPQHVPELVEMVEALLPFAILAADQPNTEAHAKLAIKLARKLLAKVKQ